MEKLENEDFYWTCNRWIHLLFDGDVLRWICTSIMLLIDPRRKTNNINQFFLFNIRATFELIDIDIFIVSFVNVSYNISTNFINFTLYVSINVEKIHLCGIASLSCSELFAYHSGIIKNSLFADSLQKCETLLGLSILHCQKPEVFWLPQWIRKGLGLDNLYPR